MDNYFILSSKVGDKWTKVTSDMTSVKLDTCIHIMGDLAHLVTFQGIPYQQPDHHSHHHFHEDFTVIPFHTQLSSQRFHDHFHSRISLSLRQEFHHSGACSHISFQLVYLVSLERD
jgi:hypothetical protein